MRYHNISKDDFLNGDGIRAVLFVSGCTHACPECHNPITWNRCGGLEFDAEAKAELFEYLKNDYVSGVTFSGGDPLAPFNRDEVLALIKEVKEVFPNKTVWCYTGFTKAQLEEQGFWDKVSPYVDVVVEGRYVAALRSQTYNWAGSRNQRVIRAESGFEINTSDPIREAVVVLKESLKDGSPERSLAEELLKAAEAMLNPNGFDLEKIASLEELVGNTIKSLGASPDKDARSAASSFKTKAEALFKERREDSAILQKREAEAEVEQPELEI